MRPASKSDIFCEILPVSQFLNHRQFNIWNCYSEHKSSYNDRLHFHNFYELSVIYEGSSDFLVNGSFFSMGKRSLQLIRPSDYHRQLTGPQEHIRYFNLMFSAEFLSDTLVGELEKNPEPLCAAANPVDWAEIIRQVRKIYDVFTNDPNDILSQIFIRNSVELLCLFLLKHQIPSSRSLSGIPQEPIRKAVSYIQKNYRSDISLANAARAAGLSPSYFSSVFHEAMGIPFARYLTSYRLQIAERYLTASDLSIKQVANVCGFSSYPYFITAFREQFGLPPGAFRSAQKN